MKNSQIKILATATLLALAIQLSATNFMQKNDNTAVRIPSKMEKVEKMYQQTKRPDVSNRLFVSIAIENEISRIKSQLTNPKLKWMFENCFPNTLDTTVKYSTIDGEEDTFVYQEIFMPCGFVIPELRFGHMFNLPILMNISNV
jgi:hypothetical protein